MSNTIRRNKNRKRNVNGPYTNPEWWYEKSSYSPYSHEIEHYSEQQIQKRIHHYHSDKMAYISYRWSWRNAEEKRLRMQHKQELIKFVKDAEYEPQFDKPYCLSWYW